MNWTIADLEKQPDGSYKAKANKKQAGSTQVIVYEVLIGIDTGKNTGFATYSTVSRGLIAVETLPIHQAMERVVAISRTFKVKVRFEDARLRKMFGTSGREKLQGAGSIKRDAVIWEDFLTDKCIPFEPVAPKDNKTKTDPDTFTKMTGWTGRTSNHARDAAMLVYGFLNVT
jgi:hypothetical protein